MSKFQTIQRRYQAKHLPKISGIKVYTLDNCFSGEAWQGTVEQWAEWVLGRMCGKLQVNAAEGTGRVSLHGNCWYEFIYAA